jgi:3',5'-cyclic-nucleotide phosphodiesterase
MEYAACNIIYVDRTAGEDRLVRREDAPLKPPGVNSSSFPWRNGSANGDVFDANENLQILLGTFSEGRINECFRGNSRANMI